MRQFPVAGVEFHRGQLIIDTTGVSFANKHYNVTIEEHGSSITVTGERPRIDMSLYTGTFNVDDITEASTITYKPWWSRTIRRKSANLVEFKERTKRTYTANNLIIENP